MQELPKTQSPSHIPWALQYDQVWQEMVITKNVMEMEGSASFFLQEKYDSWLSHVAHPFGHDLEQGNKI